MASVASEQVVVDAAPNVDVVLEPPKPILPKTLSKPYLPVDDKTIQLRIYGCELINHSGIMLHLPQLVVAAAQIYLQRFYRKADNREKYPPFFVAMTCTYLATKTQEEKRRHRDILTVYDRILKKRTTKGLHRDFKPIDPMSKRYQSWKMNMMRLELSLLNSLGYRIKVESPHSYLLQYIRFLELDNSVTEPSWTFANDSLRIPLLIDVPPKIVASACLYKGAKKTTVTLPSDWNHSLDVAMEDIEYVSDIIEEVLKFSKTKTLNYPEPDPDLPNEHIDAIQYPSLPNTGKRAGAQKADPVIQKAGSKKDKDTSKDDKKEKKESRNRKRKRSGSRDRGRKRRRHSSSSGSRSRSRTRRRDRDRKRRKRREKRH